MMLHHFRHSSRPSLFAVLAGCLLFVSACFSVAKADTDTDCVKGVAVPATGGNYAEWPLLFRLTTPHPEDPTQSNRDHTVDVVDPSVLLAAGVEYSFLDPTGFTYPNHTKAIPWSPPVNGTNDPALQALRDDNDYQYADIVVVTAYNAGFYEEHIHAGGDEVRYVIDGSGYFDIRDVNDEWVRMAARTGDLITFPSGIEHRFAVDDKLYIQAVRLFPGSDAPDWSSVPRSEHAIHGNNTARTAYVETYLCGLDPDDLDQHHDDHHSSDEDEEVSDDSNGVNDRESDVGGMAKAMVASLTFLA